MPNQEEKSFKLCGLLRKAQLYLRKTDFNSVFFLCKITKSAGCKNQLKAGLIWFESLTGKSNNR